VFVYDPDERVSARQAILDPYFNELRTSSATLPNGEPLPFDMLFNFSETELKKYSQEDMEVLIPSWYRKA